MIKLFILSILSVGLFANSIFAQQVHLHVSFLDNSTSPANDTIYYSPGRLLTWSDFKGIPVVNSVAGAVTSSGYAYHAAIEKDKYDVYVNVFIYVFFNKVKSWRDANINDSFHLLHEQNHFNLSRLGAENFYNQLTQAVILQDHIGQQLEKIFDKSYDDNILLQERYDRETEHSINRFAQLVWNKNLASVMASLKPHL